MGRFIKGLGFVVTFAVVLSLIEVSAVLAVDRDNNPPGPQGGRGTNWENPPGQQGGPGASPDRRMVRDRDNNPPGPQGGRGTNWENKPGPQGGPGASPDKVKNKAVVDQPWEIAADTNKDGIIDRAEMQQWKNARGVRRAAAQASQGEAGTVPESLREKAVADEEWEIAADTNKDGIVDRAEIQQWKSAHPRRHEGVYAPQGEQGAIPTIEERAVVDKPWERVADANKDGVVDKVEKKQYKREGVDRDNNPPGPRGGRGTNWENKPGPQGGPGASPDRRRK